MQPTTDRLPMWHFFRRIEDVLSYERDMTKYQQFWATLAGGYVPLDDGLKSFRQFCQIMYLQNMRDETLFNKILDDAIEIELDFLVTLLQQYAPKQAPSVSTGSKTDEKKTSPDKAQNDGTTPSGTATSGGSERAERASQETITKYFKPKIQNISEIKEGENATEKWSKTTKYLHSDEYFGVTRSQMVKGWQYLRRRERKEAVAKIDIKATVLKIAHDGFFYEPVYQAEFQNREDTLLIFADVRGSMVPFHELTKRLIDMAHTEGGHRRARVYYFQNYINEYVFEESNLSKPIKLETALSKANSQFTMAVIISDAGAARGNTSNQALREAQTKAFLKPIKDATAYILWLNPMPEHRWKNTAATTIAEEVNSMVAILDRDAPAHFTEILRLAARQHNNINQ